MLNALVAMDLPGAGTVFMSQSLKYLAPTYLGAVRWGDLARAGRIQECRPGALAAADALWATSVAPYNSTMF